MQMSYETLVVNLMITVIIWCSCEGLLNAEQIMCYTGAHIIDLMLLVVDITKGIQTQTAECLLIGEITCDKMIVVLNKIDLIEPAKRASTVDRVSSIDFALLASVCLFSPTQASEMDFLERLISKITCCVSVGA